MKPLLSYHPIRSPWNPRKHPNDSSDHFYVVHGVSSAVQHKVVMPSGPALKYTKGSLYNKPKKYPQQPETKINKSSWQTRNEWNMFLQQPFSLERPGVPGGITAQTLYENRLSKSLCSCGSWRAHIPEARVKGFFPKELLPTSFFTT